MIKRLREERTGGGRCRHVSVTQRQAAGDLGLCQEDGRLLPDLGLTTGDRNPRK